MTAYVLAQISIHDRERYDRYRQGFMPVLTRYGGRLLVAEERPEVLQGPWGFDKAILIEFASPAAAKAWLSSPEYREISVDREAATTGAGLLLVGVDGAA